MKAAPVARRGSHKKKGRKTENKRSESAPPGSNVFSDQMTDEENIKVISTLIYQHARTHTYKLYVHTHITRDKQN